jgi:hypothetical protein
VSVVRRLHARGSLQSSHTRVEATDVPVQLHGARQHELVRIAVSGVRDRLGDRLALLD